MINDDDDEIIQAFLIESQEGLDQLDRDLVELEQNPGSRELLSGIFRTIHTIKGTSGFLALGRLEQLTHVGENLLSMLRDGQVAMTPPIAEALLGMVDTVRALLAVVERTASDVDDSVDVTRVSDLLRHFVEGPASDAAESTPPPPPAAETDPAPAPAPVTASIPELPPGERSHPSGDATVRVDVELLDTLVRLVGELVLTRNQILQQADGDADADLIRASQRLNMVASELQESIMRTRMQPIGQAWTKFPRVVRDLGAQLGKSVRLEMSGQDTELDRTLLEAVKDPLTHLVRNSIDHGIETPDVRTAAGKPKQGVLALRAFHESGQVVVEIADDGKGIDPEKVGAVAVERGIVTQEQLARMTDRDVNDLIFRPGFSTASAVTNVSGRGVGMDVVRTNIDRIGGVVDLASRPGGGTTVRVRIPLTLAIIPALIVAESGERFSIPQANLVELVRLDPADAQRDVETLAGAPILRLRGQLLPLVSLSAALGVQREPAHTVTVVVVQADETRFGLVVDEVHDTQEIVVKPLGRQLKNIPVYAGATIMGDGRVALILDIAGLAQTSGIANARTRSASSVPEVEDDTRSLLVLDVGDDRRAALPLAKVARLEEVAQERIERTGAAEVVQYRDGILPLIRLAESIGLAGATCTPDMLSVIVHEDNGRRVGIVANRVVDVVETALVHSPVGKRPGVLGTAVVQERVTDLVDLEAVVASAGAR